jgi:dihydrofolate reductase
MKAIAAMAENRVIGLGGRIPWHLPEDFQWFKRMTLGGLVIMGRKTFESLGKPLPGRHNVVVSRTASLEGVTMVRTIQEVRDQFGDRPDCWIIGGAELYAQTLRDCTDLYLSLVIGNPPGDAFFPSFEADFEAPETIESKAGFSILHYARKQCRVDGNESVG